MTFLEHLAAAAVAGALFAGFLVWRPVLPWTPAVRKRRAGARWRRKVFSFGRPGRRKGVVDTGR